MGEEEVAARRRPLQQEVEVSALEAELLVAAHREVVMRPEAYLDKHRSRMPLALPEARARQSSMELDNSQCNEAHRIPQKREAAGKSVTKRYVYPDLRCIDGVHLVTPNSS